MDKDCQICKGEGWVCENHTDTPWGSDQGECKCGAGSPCVCNPNGDVTWQVCCASIDPSDVTPLH